MKKNLLLKAALMLLFPLASAISPLVSVTPFTMPLSASGLPDGDDHEFEMDVPPDCAEIELDSIVVLASRVGAKSPTAFTQLDRADLQTLSPSASLPMMLSLQPSVVSTNEGGTGLGYSKIRVRGSDPTRMNVTINGICYNDAESQQVFWVNLPSLSSMLNSAQLQRGVGASSSGAGAFGSSLNLQTAVPEAAPYADITLSGGSFLTGISTISAGTGRSAKGYSLDAAYSASTTEGYIRNAFARLQSFMLVAGRLTAKSSTRLVCLYGKQRTGITWEGITMEQMEADRRYNPAGEFTAADGTAGYYGNETDNYRQLHLQAIYSRTFGSRLSGSATLHYTRGGGYYENYKEDRDLRDYGMMAAAPVISDLVKRSQMLNDYYAADVNLRWDSGSHTVRYGATCSMYDGDHFGNVIWTGTDAGKTTDMIDPSLHYYDNNALKKDYSTFLKWE
ncbi:MAG: TonB-dependent receptor plug domain-containing protein, partial [Bacteroidales bacterium]|nr:TonB-dependent receptor plug domain-containing protein [Candidatus Equibacterium intestinale]